MPFICFFAVYANNVISEFSFLLFFSAAKTALNTFLFSKEASQLEKDLIKSLKVKFFFCSKIVDMRSIGFQVLAQVYTFVKNQITTAHRISQSRAKRMHFIG